MKTLLAVSLLICLLCLVRGREQGAGPGNFREPDPCRRGIDAISHFMRAKDCGGFDLQRAHRELMDSLEGNLTVDDIRYVFTNYCSTLFPVMVQCFRAFVQSCPAEQRAFLTTVLDRTGFACIPNTQQVQPNFQNLLSQLSDDDLVHNNSCTNFQHQSQRSALRGCFRKVLTGIGFGSRDEFVQFVTEARVQELIPVASELSNQIFQCIVTHFRDTAVRCPQWKGMLIRLVVRSMNVFPTILGHTMTFTPSQFNEMFGFGRGASPGADLALSAFFSTD